MKIFGYEITLKKIVDKKTTERKRGYSSKPWTTEDETQLIEMNSRGLQIKTMASRLNRTTPAICGRLHIIKKRS